MQNRLLSTLAKWSDWAWQLIAEMKVNLSLGWTNGEIESEQCKKLEAVDCYQA